MSDNVAVGNIIDCLRLIYICLVFIQISTFTMACMSVLAMFVVLRRWKSDLMEREQVP